jgi:hypothetical protein
MSGRQLGPLDAAIAIGETDRAIERATRAARLAGRSWLIYSREHNAWWRPERRGYTAHVSEAGRYTWAEIVEILGDANRIAGPRVDALGASPCNVPGAPPANDCGPMEFAIPAPRHAPPVVT